MKISVAFIEGQNTCFYDKIKIRNKLLRKKIVTYFRNIQIVKIYQLYIILLD